MTSRSFSFQTSTASPAVPTSAGGLRPKDRKSCRNSSSPAIDTNLTMRSLGYSATIASNDGDHAMNRELGHPSSPTGSMSAMRLLRDSSSVKQRGTPANATTWVSAGVCKACDNVRPSAEKGTASVHRIARTIVRQPWRPRTESARRLLSVGARPAIWLAAVWRVNAAIGQSTDIQSTVGRKSARVWKGSPRSARGNASRPVENDVEGKRGHANILHKGVIV